MAFCLSPVRVSVRQCDKRVQEKPQGLQRLGSASACSVCTTLVIDFSSNNALKNSIFCNTLLVFFCPRHEQTPSCFLWHCERPLCSFKTSPVRPCKMHMFASPGIRSEAAVFTSAKRRKRSTVGQKPLRKSTALNKTSIYLQRLHKNKQGRCVVLQG